MIYEKSYGAVAFTKIDGERLNNDGQEDKSDSYNSLLRDCIYGYIRFAGSVIKDNDC